MKTNISLHCSSRLQQILRSIFAAFYLSVNWRTHIVQIFFGILPVLTFFFSMFMFDSLKFGRAAPSDSINLVWHLPIDLWILIATVVLSDEHVAFKYQRAFFLDTSVLRWRKEWWDSSPVRNCLHFWLSGYYLLFLSFEFSNDVLLELIVCLIFIFESRLEKESGLSFNLRYFSKTVMDGEWEEVEKYLPGFTKESDNWFLLELSVEIQRQKYLEALEK